SAGRSTRSRPTSPPWSARSLSSSTPGCSTPASPSTCSNGRAIRPSSPAACSSHLSNGPADPPQPARALGAPRRARELAADDPRPLASLFDLTLASGQLDEEAGPPPTPPPPPPSPLR